MCPKEDMNEEEGKRNKAPSDKGRGGRGQIREGRLVSGGCIRVLVTKIK